MRRSCWERVSPARVAMNGKTESKCLGLLTRRERWSLSWRGWIAVLVVLVSPVTVCWFEVHVVAREAVASSLVKAAVHGKDPNWGRVAGAAGK